MYLYPIFKQAFQNGTLQQLSDDTLTISIVKTLSECTYNKPSWYLTKLSDCQLVYFNTAPITGKYNLCFIPKEELPENYINLYIPNKFKVGGEKLLAFCFDRAICRMYMKPDVTSIDIFYNMLLDIEGHGTDNIHQYVETLYYMVLFLQQQDRESLYNSDIVKVLHSQTLNSIKEGVFTKKLNKEQQAMEKKKYTDNKIKQTYRSDISIEANAKRADVSVRRMNEWIAEFGNSKNAKIKMRQNIIKANFDLDKNIKENYRNPAIQALGITYRTYIRDVNKIMTKEEINQLINDVNQFNDSISVAPVDIDVKPISVDAIISNEMADETVTNMTNNHEYTDEEISLIGIGLIADGVQIPTATGLKDLAQLPVYGDFSRTAMIREAIKSGYLTNAEQYLSNSSINVPYRTETENLSKLSGEYQKRGTEAQNSPRLRPLNAQCSIGNTMSLNLGPMNMTFTDLETPIQPTKKQEKGVTELLKKKRKAGSGLF